MFFLYYVKITFNLLAPTGWGHQPKGSSNFLPCTTLPPYNLKWRYIAIVWSPSPSKCTWILFFLKLWITPYAADHDCSSSQVIPYSIFSSMQHIWDPSNQLPIRTFESQTPNVEGRMSNAEFWGPNAEGRTLNNDRYLTLIIYINDPTWSEMANHGPAQPYTQLHTDALAAICPHRIFMRYFPSSLMTAYFWLLH